jgi:hypothetical protein
MLREVEKGSQLTIELTWGETANTQRQGKKTR